MSRVTAPNKSEEIVYGCIPSNLLSNAIVGVYDFGPHSNEMAEY